MFRFGILCLVVSVAPLRAADAPRKFHFENDIEPLLSRYNCNSSGCHGKAEGQNGFKLSVFGYDPAADHAALVKEDRGRRVLPTAPEQSLLLRKISGRVAHGGGIRIRAGSDDYSMLRDWIAAGTPFGDANAPHPIALRMEPSEKILAMHAGQQLRVVVRFSDDRELDVTRHAKFQSNNDGLAVVSPTGFVSTLDAPGDVAIMASYLGQVATLRVLVPLPASHGGRESQPQFNYIDKLVDQKLAKLNIDSSGVCDDTEFLRRAFLDVIGKLPTPRESRDFIADTARDKRARLVESLLKRSEFADYWAIKWADLLRVDRQALGHERAYIFFKWIRDSLAANKPLDQFARELLTAEGPESEIGPANFYRVAGNPGEMASSLSQTLLGVRIACAQCHHHPFDRWSQNDYYGMQAFFTSVKLQGDLLLCGPGGVATNPRSGEKVFAHALGAAIPKENPAGNQRAILAAWVTSPDNPYFARNLANRLWAHFLGRGLVEPVDDFRATNPPTNPELLDALAKHLIETRFDLRQLIREITASRVYQSSSKPNATNERDEQNYSRALLKRLDAEVLLDMICDATGVSEKFTGAPAGTRAIQLWDNKVPHYFLKQFGRPQRISACECERNTEPNVAQVLHLLNSPEIHAKLSHEGGTVAKLVKNLPDNGKLVEELYLTFFSRLPDSRERATAVQYLAKHGDKRREAAEDLAWSLLNAIEFRFNH